MPMPNQLFQNTNEIISAAWKNYALQCDITQFSLQFSWSNWMFGHESLEISASRLARHGIQWIELHGNHYEKGLGYRPRETLQILKDHGLKVSGVCGMFSPDRDLSSPVTSQRQSAIDYLYRTIDFCAEVGGSYVLTVPGAVGRPLPIDTAECSRCIDSLSHVADQFARHRIQCAIEPIRADEVSFCHTIAEAKALLQKIDHPWVRWINGDTYHMLHGEGHIGTAILDAGEALVNLHLADTNRGALGDGMMDVDIIIMAAYANGLAERRGFLTAEPLGAGADPYRRMNLVNDPIELDGLVERTITTLRTRENMLRQNVKKGFQS